jgi:hypothetical protein
MVLNNFILFSQITYRLQYTTLFWKVQAERNHFFISNITFNSELGMKGF